MIEWQYDSTFGGIVMDYISKIKKAKKNESGYWAERLFAQLEYASKISRVNKGIFSKLIDNAVNLMDDRLKATGAITKDLVLLIENELNEMSESAKKYTLLNVAHAHIDMNWMWDYSETVAITLGTFRTMLDLSLIHI